MEEVKSLAKWWDSEVVAPSLSTSLCIVSGAGAFPLFRNLTKGLFTSTRDSELPGVIVAPGQALPRVHLMICCPGTTLPRVNFIAPGQVQRYLITTIFSEFLQFLHKLLQRMNFKHVYLFWCFLELFIGKFIPNINNEHA